MASEIFAVHQRETPKRSVLEVSHVTRRKGLTGKEHRRNRPDQPSTQAERKSDTSQSGQRLLSNLMRRTRGHLTGRSERDLQRDTQELPLPCSQQSTHSAPGNDKWPVAKVSHLNHGTVTRHRHNPVTASTVGRLAPRPPAWFNLANSSRSTPTIPSASATACITTVPGALYYP